LSNLSPSPRESLIELPNGRLPVVGPLALGVGVVHDAHEARAAAGRGPLEHLLIAIGVAEGEDRAAADEAVDADGLAGAVVDELDLLTSCGLPSGRISNFTTPEEPITCSGGMPYTRSAKPRMNSTPPPDTMNVLKPLARRYDSSSSIGWYASAV
jgi:hypothetical protein